MINVVVCPVDGEYFDVTLVTSDGEFTDTLTRPMYIAVAESLYVDFSADLLRGRAPLEVQFQSLCVPDPERVTWYFGDGDSSTALNPTHTYAAAGEFEVKLVAERIGYSDSLVMPALIKTSDINADFSSDFRCGSVPMSISFSDLSTSSLPIESWSWEFGDGGVSTLADPTHDFISSGVFDVTLIVADSIASDTLVEYGCITTQDSVSAGFEGLPRSGKVPLTVMFEPLLDGIANEYFWEFGDDSTSTLRNPVHTYMQEGAYDVRLKVTLNLDDCNQVDSVIHYGYVVVHDLTATFTATPVSGIEPLAVQFTDQTSGGPDSWQWDFGDGTFSSDQHPSHLYNAPGLYDVFLRVGNPAGEDSVLRRGLITIDTAYADLVGEVWDVGARPGFDLFFEYAWTNIGTVPAENCTLLIVPPAQMMIYGVSPDYIGTGTYNGHSYAGDTIVIPLQSIDPSGYYGGYVRVFGVLPETVPLGDTLITDMWLLTPTLDNHPNNNHVRHVLEVTGSIDPNDKLANPGGKSLSFDILPDQRIRYTVQFENKPEATAEAIYIRIVDTLDPNLDWSTLTLGEMSHPDDCVVDFDPYTGVIMWWCDSIMLPPNHNPPEGEGYVMYSITPRKDLEDGTEIANSAWIRFDYNVWLHAPEAGEPIVRRIVYPSCCNGDGMRGNVDYVPSPGGEVNVADITYLVSYLFVAGPEPPCYEEGDANGSDAINVADLTFLVAYLFQGGSNPPDCP